MKWIKLFEGYKEDLQAEEERHQAELLRHKIAIEDIISKYSKANTNNRDLNIIDICVEPLVDDFGFHLYDTQSILAYKGMRYYMRGELHENTLLTQELYNALFKTNNRIKSEFTDREIYIHIGVNGTEDRAPDWLPSKKKYQIPSSECSPVDNMAVRLDYVADILKMFIGKNISISILI